MHSKLIPGWANLRIFLLGPMRYPRANAVIPTATSHKALSSLDGVISAATPVCGVITVKVVIPNMIPCHNIVHDPIFQRAKPSRLASRGQ